MLRDTAIDLIVQYEVNSLSLEDREGILQNWWSIDSNDVEYKELSPQLKLKLSQNDAPVDPADCLYDSLIEIAIKYAYEGVLNSFIEYRLSKIGRLEKVEGEFSMLESCPCCKHKSLRARGQYEICPVCLWEDTGANDVAQYSAPNKMTLGEARANFVKFGAMSEDAVRLVDAEAKMKY